MSAIAAKVPGAWHTPEPAAVAEGHRLLVNDAIRFDGVSVTGVAEHVSRAARRGGKCCTVIIDLAPISQRTGPARLSDLGEGRSKQFLDSDCFESRESTYAG